MISIKQLFIAFAATGLAVATACNSGSDTSSTGGATTPESTESGAAAGSGEASNPKGIGPHQNVKLNSPLDLQMIATGKSVYEVKCQSCHKLTDERLVGPGWKGVTDRRTPEWIMNFTTNTEEMLEKDTAAQNMLEVCLVKMPNQGVPESDARGLVEFMLQNDGKK